MRIKSFSFLLLAVFTLALSFANLKYTNIDVKLQSVNPNFPKASDNIAVSFLIYNQGTKDSYVKVYFLNNSVFKFVSANKNLSRIFVGSYSYTNFDAYFKVTDVKTGKYPLNLKVCTNDYCKYFTFFIEIRNPTTLKLIPKTTYCLLNSKCNFSFLLLNQGYGNAKNVVVSFDLPSHNIFVKNINALSLLNLSTNLFIPENLKEGYYNLKATVSFLDDLNNLRTETFSLPIELKSNVNLSISSIEFDKNENWLKIKVENPGYGKAKDIVVRVIIPSENINRTFFIGSLDTNEDSTLYIYLPKDYKPGTQEVIIKLSWYDNKEKEKEVKASIYLPKDKKESNFIYLIVAIFVILAISLLIYKKKVVKNEN